MGKMKDIAIAEQERQAWQASSGEISFYPSVDNPTSLMEIQYEESVEKLKGKYHRLTNEEIEVINRLANKL